MSERSGGTATNPFLQVPDLVTCWTFQEPAGRLRQGTGTFAAALREGAGEIGREKDGILGPYAANLQRGQWFFLPRGDLGPLDIHGPDAQVSVVAWVKRRHDDGSCEAVAGIWNETDARRQYCLFLNLGIYDSAEQVGGHISATGGPSPGHRYCMEAAIGETPVPYGAWHLAGFTYDGYQIRACLDGAVDRRPRRNPYSYPNGIFNGGHGGADFTVGAVHRSGEMGNFFQGLLGGLAVYRRALTEREMAALYLATKPKA